MARRVHDPSQFICDLDIAASLTLCVNGAHESSVVHDIPAELVREEMVAGGVKVTVLGLDDLIHRAFEQEKLFYDTGVEWAQAGDLIDMGEGYDFFPPCNAGKEAILASKKTIPRRDNT